ncbi:hypothetical protein ACNF40_02455 [Cuniculiplasma sp. SKW4]|uniref:hypothetical protein n=1 Tax=Cuniculiplasma sp. SKW4 TaxID=3400171 RepID=UPI003FD06E94
MGINEIREEIISRKLLFLSEEIFRQNAPLQYLLLALAKNNPFLSAVSEYAKKFDAEKFSDFVQSDIIDQIKGSDSEKIFYIEKNFEIIRERCENYLKNISGNSSL